MDCQTQLRTFKFTEECFLSKDHYIRAKMALSFKDKVILHVDEYTIVVVKNDHRSFQFVLGIDSDTNKIFVNFINNSAFASSFINSLDSRYIRNNLYNFDYNKDEVVFISDGNSIRIQGDLILFVEKTFINEENVVCYFSRHPFGENVLLHRDVFQSLWEDFFRQEMGDVMRKPETYSALLEEIRTIIHNYLNNNKPPPKHVIKHYLMLRDYFFRYNPDLPNIEGVRLKVARKFKNKFKEFLKKKEEKLVLKLGNYTAPHIIEITGILTNARRFDNSNYIITLREQELKVTHKEHGVTTFYLDKPALIYFRTR